MDDKKLLTNVTIKQEPNTSTSKKVLLSSSTFAPLVGKGVSNARLPSFKPPRDLFLTGSVTGNSNSTFSFNSTTKGTKRTFMPNIHVTRKKAGTETVANDSTPDPNSKTRDRNKRTPYNNKSRKNANVVQTKGVFSEGLAPGRVKAFGSSSGERTQECRILDKPKLNLTKTIHKSDEDTKLKSILKDDFIDDPSHVPDINFIPKSLPMIYNVKSPNVSDDLEKTFESLQVKNEKVANVNIDEENLEKPISVLDFEGNQGPKMLLFEFPSFLRETDDTAKKKKITKGQPSADAESEAESYESLSSLGEGFFGYLRIHENGRAFLVLGKTTIPLCQARHGTRQEILSATVHSDTLKGELISLGTIDSGFTCSANIFQGVS